MPYPLALAGANGCDTVFRHSEVPHVVSGTTKLVVREEVRQYR